MRNVTVDTDVPRGHIPSVSGYTKLFSHIVHSTIWREPDHVRIVWVTMLALKDSHGDVMASVPGLADAARVTEEQCDDALKRLTAPDPRSRSKDLEGRRLIEVDGGWHCVNHDKYKRMLSIEDRRERDRERKRAERVRGTSEKSPNSNIRSDPDQIRSDPSPPVGVPVAQRPKQRRVLWHVVPDGWQPTGNHRERTSHWSPGLFDRELEKFRSHEFAQGKSDPDRTFTRWLAEAETRLKIPPRKVAPKIRVDW
jgi:hypothetical protein